MTEDLRTEFDPSMDSLIAGIAQDGQDLVKQHMALLRWELKDNLCKTREAALSLILGVGLVLAGIFLCGLMVSHLLNWALPSLPLWACYGVVGSLVIGSGVGQLYIGKRRLELVQVLPERTAEAFREHVKWILNPK